MTTLTEPSFNRLRTGYTLKRGDVDDGHPGIWHLQRGPDTDAEVVATYPTLPGHATRPAQVAAHKTLRTLGVRLIRWDPAGDGRFHAVTGPAHGAWHVTTYQTRGGQLWHRRSDDKWYGPGGACYPTTGALDRAQGPLTPHTVHNLPALIEELAIFKAITVYFGGSEDCHERECDGYDEAGNVIDADGRRIPDRDRCLHLDDVIATSGEALALHRVVRALSTLDALSTIEPDRAHLYRNGDLDEAAGIRRAVAAIREAIEGET